MSSDFFQDTVRMHRIDWLPPGRLWPRVLLYGLVCFLLTVLALFLSRQPGSIATLWYINGLTVALLLHQPPGQWWAWLLAAAAANLAGHLLFGDSIGQALLFLPPNLLEVMLGTAVLYRLAQHREALRDPIRLCWTVLLGVLVPGIGGATLGVLMLAPASTAEFADTWLSWFEGTAIGGTAILPLALWLLQQGRDGLRSLLQPNQVALWLIVLAAALLVPLWLPYPFVYLSVLLAAVALWGSFGSTGVGVLLVSLGVGALIANGVFQPPPLTARWQQLLFYLPLFLTVMPPLLLAAAVDDRRQTLQRLRDSEARYRSLYRRTPMMMHSVGPDGRVLNVSELWLKKLGYQEHEVLGRRWTDFLGTDSCRHAQEQVLPRLEREGRCDDVPYQWVGKDGRLLDGLFSAILDRGADGVVLRTMAVIEDVTERNRLAAELAASELFEVTLQSIGDGVVTTDARGYIEQINPVAEHLLGCSRAEAHGLAFDQLVQLFDDRTGERIADPVRRCLDEMHRTTLPETALLRARSGHEYAVQNSVAPILGKGGQLLGTVMVFQDVTETRALSERMSHLAQHDVLTDLPNRVLLQDRIAQCCQRGQRDDLRFAVMMLDLDHFKRVNDTLGHAAGDTLLRVVAGRLSNVLRASDTVCRLGGDEFVILLAELPIGDDAADVAEKILHEVARPVELGSTVVDLSVSLGIASFPEDGDDPETLMRHADTAMYRAKREGRNSYRFFTRSMDEAVVQRLALEHELQQALEHEQFALHFQPVIDVLRRQVVGAEALVRWQHPGGGLVSPGRFVPTAEESRLIRPLGRWIVRQACEQHLQWREAGFGALCVSVNVSPIELEDPGFLTHLAEILSELGVEGRYLELEITEATLMRDQAATTAVLHQVKQLGVRIALDDFGAGYSSLSDLKRLPIDTIKIDASFVRGLGRSPADREIVRAILAVGRGLGLRVIAEGVETAEQLDALRSLGCTELQGHLLARPAPASMWRKLVNAIVVPG
jgi:diguanylate cyclase (GGDEF)-like protein/PAS domain S-box-containing protein